MTILEALQTLHDAGVEFRGGPNYAVSVSLNGREVHNCHSGVNPLCDPQGLADKLDPPPVAVDMLGKGVNVGDHVALVCWTEDKLIVSKVIGIRQHLVKPKGAVLILADKGSILSKRCVKV